MTVKEQICRALCDGFVSRQVPMGFAIRSPFDWFTGDKLTFYVRVRGSQMRLEDSGSTIFDLEGAGVDLSSVTRQELLEALCKEHGVLHDEDESVFHTEWLDEGRVGLAAITFVAFLQRLQDLTFTTRTRVASTFKDDLISALAERFGGEAEIVSDEPPVPSLSYYVVDILVKHKSGKVAAIFPGTSEQKALEAVLFAKEVELRNIDNVVPFLVFEQTQSGKIRKDTNAKALNSELQLAAWDGGRLDVLDKVAKRIGAAR